MPTQDHLNAFTFRQIQQLVDKYAKHQTLSGLAENSFLVFGKPTSENLEKYQSIFKKADAFNAKGNLWILSSYVKTCVQIVFLSSMKIASSLITPFEWWRIRPYKSKAKYLTLEILPRYQKNMRWVSSFPRKLRYLTNNDENLTLILNGTRIPSPVLKRKLELFGLNLLVLPKTLSPVRTLRLMLSDTKLSISLSKIYFSKHLNEPLERFFVLEMMKWQFLRATHSNQVIKEEIERLIQCNSELQGLLLTLEGHIHERVLIKSIKNHTPKATIHSYIHAPVLKAQNSLYENVSELRSTDNVHLTGVIPKGLLVECTSFKISSMPKLSICGSEKRMTLSSKRMSEGNSILLVPEGTQAATREILDLMDFIIQERPEFNFILRIHPALSGVHRIIRSYSTRDKIESQISNSSLISDLSNSLCSIYRGSAVAIQGLEIGVFPIHYSKINFISLDPIDKSQLNHAACSNPNHVINEIDKIISMRPSEKSHKLRQMSCYARNYFSRP
jgi:hypothetical protein